MKIRQTLSHLCLIRPKKVCQGRTDRLFLREGWPQAAGEQKATWVLAFVGKLLSHREHSLAFMYFGRTKRLGKPAKIWTCFWEPVSRSTVINLRETEQRWWILEVGPTWGCVEAFTLFLPDLRRDVRKPVSLSSAIRSSVSRGLRGTWNSVEKRKFFSVRNIPLLAEIEIFIILFGGFAANNNLLIYYLLTNCLCM